MAREGKTGEVTARHTSGQSGRRRRWRRESVRIIKRAIGVLLVVVLVVPLPFTPAAISTAAASTLTLTP